MNDFHVTFKRTQYKSYGVNAENREDAIEKAANLLLAEPLLDIKCPTPWTIDGVIEVQHAV